MTWRSWLIAILITVIAGETYMLWEDYLYVTSVAYVIVLRAMQAEPEVRCLLWKHSIAPVADLEDYADRYSAQTNTPTLRNQCSKRSSERSRSNPKPVRIRQ